MGCRRRERVALTDTDVEKPNGFIAHYLALK
jgi:hypothetical protein